MKIYCSCCDKVQPVKIDDCRDAKTNEPFQDIVCIECDLVIASGTDIAQPEQGPIATVESVATVVSESGNQEITMSWWHEPALPVGTKLYTTPPHRKPLPVDDSGWYWLSENECIHVDLIRKVEAAHNIKEQP